MPKFELKQLVGTKVGRGGVVSENKTPFDCIYVDGTYVGVVHRRPGSAVHILYPPDTFSDSDKAAIVRLVDERDCARANKECETLDTPAVTAEHFADRKVFVNGGGEVDKWAD